MIQYVDTIDELVDLIDKEYCGNNAVCPVCRHKIGTVGVPDLDIGLSPLKYTQFKHPGVYCVEGHALIILGKENEKEEEKKEDRDGLYRINVEDLGIKVSGVMKLVRPLLNIDSSVPNNQLYWMLMDKSNSVFIKNLSYSAAEEILEKLQKLGARVSLVKQQGVL